MSIFIRSENMLQCPRLKLVTQYALISRLLIFGIQTIPNFYLPKNADSIIFRFHNFANSVIFSILLVTFNLLIPDHDADVFNPPPDPTVELSSFDFITQFLIRGFKRWDAVYFLHIAEYGYTYENTVVFFPLFPVLTRILANSVFYPAQFLLSYSNVLLLVAVLMNNFLFVKSAQLLYKLGISILNEENLAFKAAILFCFNPASIFMSAPYSEILYCYLLLRILLKLEEDSNISAAILVGFCTLARSNGLIALGFVFYSILRILLNDLEFLGLLGGEKKAYENKNDEKVIFRSVVLFTIVKCVLCAIMAVSPFLIYQYICYWKFCDNSVANLPEHIIQYGWSRNYHILGDDISPWCYDILPLSYSYVQKHHWGVGFMKYYQRRQIPNFLLAAPVIVLSVVCLWTYFKLNRQTCLTLGLARKSQLEKKSDRIEVDLGFKNQKLLVHCCHLLFLVLFGCFFMHIQVLTRMLFSSCPVLYWFSAYLLTDKLHPAQTINKYDTFKLTSQNNQVIHAPDSDDLDQLLNWSKQPLSFKLISGYFLGYFVLGTIAFTNFFPFT